MAAVGFLDAVRPVLPEVVAFLRPWEADILSKTCSSARRRVAESRTYWLRSLTALCHGPPALEADRHLGDTAATATLSTAALRKRVLREEDGLWATQRLVWWATWHYQVQAAIIGVALFAFYWYIHLHVSSPTSVTAARYVVPVCMSSHPWRRCRPPLCDKEAVNTAYFYAHGDTIIEESPLQMHRHYYHHFPNVRVPGYTSTNTSQCPWVPSRLPRCDGVEQCPTDPLAIARAVGRQLNDERSDRRYTYTYHAWTSALSYLFVGAAFLVSLGLLLLLREDSPPVVHRARTHICLSLVMHIVVAIYACAAICGVHESDSMLIMPTADILFCILPVPLLISVGARICDWQFAGRNSQPVPMLWVRVQHEQLRTLGGRWPPVWEVTLEVRSLVSGWPPPDAIYVYLPGRRVYACVPLIAATAAGQAQSWTAEVFFEAECGWGAGLPALGWSL